MTSSFIKLVERIPKKTWGLLAFGMTILFLFVTTYSDIVQRTQTLQEYRKLKSDLLDRTRTLESELQLLTSTYQVKDSAPSIQNAPPQILQNELATKLRSLAESMDIEVVSSELADGKETETHSTVSVILGFNTNQNSLLNFVQELETWAPRFFIERVNLRTLNAEYESDATEPMIATSIEIVGIVKSASQ